MAFAVSRRGILAFAGVTAVSVLVGCGPPVLETSSLDAIEESLLALREPLEVEACDRFDESLAYLVGGARPADGIADPDLEPLILEVYKPLQGSTVESVLAEARARRIAQVAAEVEKLEVGRKASVEAREELAKMSLGSGRIFKINKGYLEWPMLELKVGNETRHSVFMVKLRAALLSPDDTEPWMVEEIDYLIYEGMAPGERDLWRIEPEKQEWINFLDPHPELSFSVEVMKLTTVGKEVAAYTEWGLVEAHALEIYERTLRTIRESGGLALDQPPKVELPRAKPVT